MLARYRLLRGIVACIATAQSYARARILLSPHLHHTNESFSYTRLRGSIPSLSRSQVGLFFYDVFWVFGTDVMVSVATKFDAPIKLLFPRALATEDTSVVLQMLGLGDIVMPGLFIALLLRFDFHRAFHSKLKSIKDKKQIQQMRETLRFDKSYFNMCILFYTLGLVATVWVMHTFKHAQPALLYLVPACVGAALLTGIARGELKALLAYEEEEEEADEKNK